VPRRVQPQSPEAADDGTGSGAREQNFDPAHTSTVSCGLPRHTKCHRWATASESLATFDVGPARVKSLLPSISGVHSPNGSTAAAWIPLDSYCILLQSGVGPQPHGLYGSCACMHPYARDVCSPYEVLREQHLADWAAVMSRDCHSRRVTAMTSQADKKYLKPQERNPSNIALLVCLPRRNSTLVEMAASGYPPKSRNLARAGSMHTILDGEHA
jgi:hypothetical protein